MGSQAATLNSVACSAMDGLVAVTARGSLISSTAAGLRIG